MACGPGGGLEAAERAVVEVGEQVAVALKELVVKQVEVVDMPLDNIPSNLAHIKLW